MRAPSRFVLWVWAIVSVLCLACGGSSVESSGASSSDIVPIWRDDYTRALGTARSRGTLLFVDAWAPWCPPCRLFHEEVLHDARLERFRPYFVFATINTDQPTSVAFRASRGQRVWPTLFVIDPADEEVVAMLEGAPTFTLFAHFLHRALTRKYGPAVPAAASP